VTSLSKERIVAGLAKEKVARRATDQGVIACPAKQICAGQRPVRFIKRDNVVAALAEYLDQAGIRDGRGAAKDRNGATVDQNVSGCVETGRDRVIEGVPQGRQQPIG